MTSRLTFQPGSHQYWLRNPDGNGRQRLPSVTTLLKQLDKPALTRWASNTAAEYAIDNWADLEQLTPSERRKQIAAAPWSQRDRAAASGTAIHAMAEQLLAGEPVEVPDSLTSKVEGLAKWIEATGIQIVASEVRVWTEPDDEFGLVGYAGTFDAVAKHPQFGLTLIDWKSGSGIYAEHALQLAGYKTADWMVVDGEDELMMRVDTLAAVHVQTGFSELHTLADDAVEAAVDKFHCLRNLANIPTPEFQAESLVMTGSELVPHDTDSWVDVLEPAYRLAQGIARTDFVPKGLQGRPDAIMAAVLAGRERGLGPMVSLAGISVINGRPTLSAELLAALVVRAGHTIDVLETSDKACEVRITRGDNQSTAVVRWSKADAEQAGLWNKQGPWRMYPRQMLYARAVSEAARRVCPDVAWGLDTDATVADTAPTTRPATVVQLQPAKGNAPDGDGEPSSGAPDPTETLAETVAAPSDTVEEPEPEPEPPTPELPPKYVRKIMTELTKLERIRGRKLDRGQRLVYLAHLAGIPELQTMKDLTEIQARQIIDALIAAQPQEQPTLEGE